MNLSKSIHKFRQRRKILREKPHVWEIPSAKACYIQNYKVATRSIRHAIARHILKEQNDIREYDQIPLELVRQLDKKVSSFYTPAKIRKLYPEHYIFTFVRDPLARLYSCYSNKLIDAHRKNMPNRFAHFGITPENSFDEFVRIVADIPDKNADRHFRSQHWFVNDGDKDITDYVGKLENLREDWQYLIDKFGFPELPHKNKSLKKTANPREHYSSEIYKIAQERYRQDIEQFGYQDNII
jgi:hypothetical protein